MEKHFNTNIKIKVDKENNVGSLSIKESEHKVSVYKMSLNELRAFINTAYNEINQ